MKTLKRIMIITAVCLTAAVACHFAPDSHRYLAPCGMGVTKVLYVEEKLFGLGFLPGDNETGVIAFRLPEEVPTLIREGGVNYLNSLKCPENANRLKRRGQYNDWQETPVVNDRKWDAESLELMPFLGKYGFPIPIDRDIEAEINKAIQIPGSFYAHSNGGGGVILLVPNTGKAYFFYAG